MILQFDYFSFACENIIKIIICLKAFWRKCNQTTRPVPLAFAHPFGSSTFAKSRNIPSTTTERVPLFPTIIYQPPSRNLVSEVSLIWIKNTCKPVSHRLRARISIRKWFLHAQSTSTRSKKMISKLLTYSKSQSFFAVTARAKISSKRCGSWSILILKRRFLLRYFCSLSKPCLKLRSSKQSNELKVWHHLTKSNVHCEFRA